MGLTTFGLVLDIIGVFLIMLHTLYDVGIQASVRVIDKAKKNKRPESSTIVDKLVKRKKLTEMERDILKENFTVNMTLPIVTCWLWINKTIFRFYPWIEKKPRLINKFLWNLFGMLLILSGFVFQFFGVIMK